MARAFLPHPASLRTALVSERYGRFTKQAPLPPCAEGSDGGRDKLLLSRNDFPHRRAGWRNRRAQAFGKGDRPIPGGQTERGWVGLEPRLARLGSTADRMVPTIAASIVVSLDSIGFPTVVFLERTSGGRKGGRGCQTLATINRKPANTSVSVKKNKLFSGRSTPGSCAKR